jgi:hypothetical protein
MGKRTEGRHRGTHQREGRREVRWRWRGGGGMEEALRRRQRRSTPQQSGMLVSGEGDLGRWSPHQNPRLRAAEPGRGGGGGRAAETLAVVGNGGGLGRRQTEGTGEVEGGGGRAPRRRRKGTEAEAESTRKMGSLPASKRRRAPKT